MEDREYHVQECADKLCSTLVHTIEPCLAILNSGKEKEAKECELCVYLYELNLVIRAEENTAEIWRAIEQGRINDVVKSLQKIVKKARKMPFVQQGTKEIIKCIKKRRRGCNGRLA